MANFTPVGVELVVKGADKFNSTLGKATSSIAGFGKAAVKTAAVGVAAMGAAVTGIGIASVQAAVSWESAFAGVRKTVNTTEEEFDELEQSLRDVAKVTPVDVEDLAAIAELGGQLGIVDENTKDVSGSLTEFTKTIAAMGVSTNLTTEEAAVGFAQLANIMNTPNEQISNMGSAIVALGNNFATTERDVLNFAQRIAGAGQIAGLTESQVFAIGAAMSSVGVQAEAGGTAVQKVLLTMNEAALEGEETWDVFAGTAALAVEDFADAFGLSVSEITNLIETDMGAAADLFGELWEEDAGQAFDLFVKGLGAAGDDALTILDGLELKDQRLTRAFLSLAGAGDLLTDTMNTSSEAFAANSALTDEAAQRYATTESQFKIFRNTIKDIAITIGQALLPIVNDLLEAAKPLIATFAEFATRLGEGISKLVKQFKGFGIKDFFSTFEDGSSVLEGFFQTLGLSEGPARSIANVINKAAQAVMGFVSIVRGTIENLVHLFRFGEGLHPSEFIPGFFELPESVQKVVEKITDVLQRVVVWLQDNIPKAAKAASKFWKKTLLPALRDVGKFITGTVIPVLEGIFNWLGDKIPDAIEILVSFWEGTLQPALIRVVDFIKNNVEPILAAIAVVIFTAVIPAIVAWAAANVAAAIATIVAWAPILLALAALGAAVFLLAKAWKENWGGIRTAITKAWNNTIKPVLAQIQGWISHAVIPAVRSLVGWLSVNIPKAFNTVKAFWKRTLKPALEAIWEFIKENVIPIVMDVFNWLKEKIPEAFQAVKMFWENTLRPALEDLWAFIRDNVIPIIIEVFGWLHDRLTEAFQRVRDFWESTLRPALNELWEFIRDKIIPIIKEVIEWLKEKLVAGFQAVKTAWEKYLKGAFRDIWAFINNTLIPIIRDLWEWVSDKLVAGFEIARNAWFNTLKPAFEDLIEIVRDVIDWVRDAIDWVQRLLGLQSEIDPTGGGGGSGFGGPDEEPPPPTGPPVDGDGDGDGDVPFDEFNFGSSRLTQLGPVPLGGLAAAAAGTTREVNINFATTINTDMDMRTFEQRVVRVVTENIG